ncbi:MAG TPA: DmsC/YnfH family molybdoenzyme membrane anchor subunit [Chthoniobacterales bacterium]|jgi:Fe-S-cluster-containing dehydrogenase component/DMSO reductase anchor subunit
MTETNLIDELLAEQQSLTAVERFSQKHANSPGHLQARYYKDLIPLSKPLEGEQYAFAVDLDKCTGCKACVSACHSLNGLDEEEVWRDIGLLRTADEGSSYQQTVTTACHHCLDPACADGCPVLAYEKDQETGIVRHLDDQCIGCQYCVLKCPYEVPKYNKKRGIVRKCDMCHQRLAVGEAPACVQACPSGAIAIQIVGQETLRAQIQPGDRLLPGAFDSSYTRPTTNYASSRTFRGRPADEHKLRVEHAHWPLVFMLVFTQAAVGLLLVNGLWLGQAAANVVAFVLLNIGLGLSVLHLGQPLKAWRAFLGWRKSWMSREIMAFSAFAGVAAALTASGYVTLLPVPDVVKELVPHVVPFLLGATIVSGLAAVFTSCMIYVDTRRAFWSMPTTSLKFYGTAIGLGLAAAGFWNSSFALAGAGTLIVMFLAELFLLKSPAVSKPRAILFGPLQKLQITRALLLVAALCTWQFPVAAFVALLLAQIIERGCFFMASAAPKMAGGI